MQCPICHHTALEMHSLEAGLVAQQCAQCRGTLLPLLNYRYWVYQHPNAQLAEVSADVEEHSEAKQCPRCTRLMTKYAISASETNRVDFCSHCDHVWLDGGEWELLKKLQLTHKVSDLFTEAWQRKVRKEKAEARMAQHFSSRWGGETFDKVNAFKQWLCEQPNSDEIRHFLTMRD